MFLSSLNLDSAVTNFIFPLYTRVTKSIIHSNKPSTLYTFNTAALNEDLSPPCRRADLFQAMEVTGAGTEEGNQIDSVLGFLPRRFLLRSLLDARGSLLIRPVTVHLCFPGLSDCDSFSAWLFFSFPFFFSYFNTQTL